MRNKRKQDVQVESALEAIEVDPPIVENPPVVKEMPQKCSCKWYTVDPDVRLRDMGNSVSKLPYLAWINSSYQEEENGIFLTSYRLHSIEECLMVGEYNTRIEYPKIVGDYIMVLSAEVSLQEMRNGKEKKSPYKLYNLKTRQVIKGI